MGGVLHQGRGDGQTAGLCRIDVAQATLEVAVRPTGEAWQVANDEIAFGDLVERVRQLKRSFFVLEATGGIHLPVVAALAAAKLPVVAVNPRQA
jgi:transposase